MNDINELLVGVSLLYSKFESNEYEAILSSYILQSIDHENVIKEVSVIGERDSVLNDEFYIKYFGIEDIFKVVGPISDGALLGRMTVWDKTMQDAVELVLSENKFSINLSKQFSRNWYLATPVYYVTSKESDDARIISCHCLVESLKTSSVENKARLIANSSMFKRKIVELDSEGLVVEELNFLGFENISNIKDDIMQGGPFMKLSKMFNSEDEIRTLLIDNEELIGFFDNF